MEEEAREPCKLKIRPPQCKRHSPTVDATQGNIVCTLTVQLEKPRRSAKANGLTTQCDKKWKYKSGVQNPL